MSIVSITWARNEGDILEAFVRHHCALLDRMYIILHRTDDDSEAILVKLRAEGLPVAFRRSDVAHHAQSEALTGLMHEIAKTHAPPEWILPLDADEFLSFNGSLSGFLTAMDSSVVPLLPWKTYVPLPNDPTYNDVRLRIKHRRENEPQTFSKVLIHRSVARESILPLGSHALHTGEGMSRPARLQSSLWLSHFPVRSEAQLRKKILNGWESYTKNPDRTAGQLFQWERLYARCKDPSPIDASELFTIALQYAVHEDVPIPVRYDPVPIPVPERGKESRIRCAFIVVWLGPFPIWLDFFVESASRNSGTFDWLIMTDQQVPKSTPSNMFFFPMDLAGINTLIRDRLHYPVTLKVPYKLCDLKPFYGLLFSRHLQHYSHWGHADLDIVWGNLEHYFTPALRKGYDIVTAASTRISGYCTVYKNTPRITTLCMQIPKAEQALQEQDYAYLDEWRLPQLLAERPDISVSYESRTLENPDLSIVTWENGTLFAGSEERPLLHMHTWARTRKNMTVDAPDTWTKERWLINRGGFSSGEHIQKSERHTAAGSEGILIAADGTQGEDLLALLASIRELNTTPILVIDRGLSTEQKTALHKNSNVMCIAAETYAKESSLPALIEHSPFETTLWLSPHCYVLAPLQEAFMLMREHMIVSMHHGALMNGALESVRISADAAKALPPMHPKYNPIFHLSIDVLGFRRTMDAKLLHLWKACLVLCQENEEFRQHISGPEKALLWAMQYEKRQWDICSNHAWNAVPVDDTFSGNKKMGDRIVNRSWKKK